jgi:hypothetical protein
VNQKNRIIIAVALIVVIAGAVLGIEVWRRGQSAELAPGSIPIYVDGRRAAAFVPDDLEQLEQVSFVDDEEGKTQEGWLLRDVLELYLPSDVLVADAVITVSSSSRDKSVELTWTEVRDRENMVMFDLSGRGTLKLVSKQIERLDVRDEWVQDVDSIEVRR